MAHIKQNKATLLITLTTEWHVSDCFSTSPRINTEECLESTDRYMMPSLFRDSGKLTYCLVGRNLGRYTVIPFRFIIHMDALPCVNSLIFQHVRWRCDLHSTTHIVKTTLGKMGFRSIYRKCECDVSSTANQPFLEEPPPAHLQRPSNLVV